MKFSHEKSILYTQENCFEKYLTSNKTDTELRSNDKRFPLQLISVTKEVTEEDVYRNNEIHVHRRREKYGVLQREIKL
jgi:hypothetical protein